VSHEALNGAPTGRTAARLAKQVELALAALDLSVSQYRLLVFLSDGPSQASALAERLIVSRPSVTALADGLVERGLVTREGAAVDRRQVMHVLTEEGLRVLAEADGAIETRLSNIAANVGENEQRRAFRGLEAWEKAMNAARAKAVVARAAGNGGARS
jgi:long-chain acyl-CoA synthetase